MVEFRILNWITDQIEGIRATDRAQKALGNAKTLEELQAIYDGLSEPVRMHNATQELYKIRVEQLGLNPEDVSASIKEFLSAGLGTLKAGYDDVSEVERKGIQTALEEWIEAVKVVNPDDPDQATEKLAHIATTGINIAAVLRGIQVASSFSPLKQAEVANTISTSLIKDLGIAAVIAAISHDPVKIGVLRPWQDALESSFRNKRPNENMTFQAYRTRELSPIIIEDVDQVDDELMKKVEDENDAEFTREMSRHGYTDAYIRALSFSATYTPRFNDMMQLARQGLLNRGMAIYSLWGAGYDKLTMPKLLDALMEQNRRGSYEGFRSMIEPAYREGIISEEDLRAYWTRISVPLEVQEWVMPRLKRQREKFLAKEEKTLVTKERDLTVSQVQQSFQNKLIDRAAAQNMIMDMGYDSDEANVLLDLAELRRKAPKEPKTKRLSLTDYEKAYKNGIITLDDVLDRMKGEYQEKDIAIERAMLLQGIA